MTHEGGDGARGRRLRAARVNDILWLSDKRRAVGLDAFTGVTALHPRTTGSAPRSGTAPDHAQALGAPPQRQRADERGRRAARETAPVARQRLARREPRRTRRERRLPEQPAAVDAGEEPPARRVCDRGADAASHPGDAGPQRERTRRGRGRFRARRPRRVSVATRAHSAREPPR